MNPPKNPTGADDAPVLEVIEGDAPAKPAIRPLDISTEAVPDLPTVMPAEISDATALPGRALAVGRLEAWASDTRHLLRTLEHDFEGDVGKLIAYLRDKLLS